MSNREKGIMPARGAARTATRRRLVTPLAAAALAILASAGVAVASELPCADDFCTPVDATQLDRYRAQGIDGPSSGDKKVGVILWDEYRRLRQPGDTTGVVANGAPIMNASVTGGMATSIH
jgi:hypothetical protein